MKNTLIGMGFSLVVCLMAVATTPALAQGGFESVTGDAFVRAVPGDFYLEGNRIPVEKRDAALLKNGKGGRVVAALINTTGYSSQIKQKYIGMLITETKISVCGNPIGVGSYGFGLDRPPAGSNAAAVFKLYDQAGEKVFECTVQKDNNIKQPKPLAVSTPKGTPARLELGKYAVEIE
jgi:hypothetical protein